MAKKAPSLAVGRGEKLPVSKDENGKPTRKAASLKRWKC
jgi:hypothetical protein